MRDDQYRDLADFLKALAHPTRLKILGALLEGEMCVRSLWEELNLQQSNISQHLATLRARGIISFRREGAKVCYSVIDPKTKEVMRTLMALLSSEEEGTKKQEGHNSP